MVFSSFLFLFAFLPGCLALYYLAPRQCKNYVALIMSLFFYAWGAPQVAPFLLLSCTADFIISSRIVPSSLGRRRTAWLVVGLVINLSLLAYYKYFNFFAAQLNQLFSFFGTSTLQWSEVALPIGISFFTFHKISYLVDIYRGTAARATSFPQYLLYILLFPQLVAGPIVRYHDIAPQLDSRPHTLELFFEGLMRFCRGLAKKVLIADTLGSVTDILLGERFSQITGPYAWLAMVCYSFQIYFDFSGYSDMAIGLGRMLGFRFLENFNQPYIAKNFTEFWKRWHISLTNFMREYLYIPLGGNRVSPARTYLNLWVVFLLSGLWHGASWNFVIWGSYHGLFLVLDRSFWISLSKKLPGLLAIALTFLLVTVGWVFFRASSLHQSVALLQLMFDFPSWNTHSAQFPRASVIHNRAVATLIIAAVICFVPALPVFQRLRARLRDHMAQPLWLAGTAAGAYLIFILSVCSLASADYSPFLYFKF